MAESHTASCCVVTVDADHAVQRLTLTTHTARQSWMSTSRDGGNGRSTDADRPSAVCAARSSQSTVLGGDGVGRRVLPRIEFAPTQPTTFCKPSPPWALLRQLQPRPARPKASRSLAFVWRLSRRGHVTGRLPNFVCGCGELWARWPMMAKTGGTRRDGTSVRLCRRGEWFQQAPCPDRLAQAKVAVRFAACAHWVVESSTYASQRGGPPRTLRTPRTTAHHYARLAHLDYRIAQQAQAERRKRTGVSTLVRGAARALYVTRNRKVPSLKLACVQYAARDR